MAPASRLLLAALLAGPTLLACTRPGPVARPPDALVAPAAPPVVRAVSSSLQIRLSPRLDPSPALDVEMLARGLTSAVWEIPALAGVEVVDLTLRDDAGDIAFGTGRAGHVLRITPGRAVTGALRIRYTVKRTWDDAAALDEAAALLLLRIDRERVLAAGEQVLLLPATLPAAPVELSLTIEPAGELRLATSLGLAAPRRLSLAELRHAAILIGRLGHAEFRGPGGEDDFAWAGETRFDPRWAAAETAGARTAVDAYFGAEPNETARFTGLFAVDVEFPGEEGALVVPRSGGLYVALSPGAKWDAVTRLAIAQGLVHRWLGGRLRLREHPGDPPEAGAWFDAGVARFVAREVLWSLGTLSTEDYATEINAHLAEVTTSPLRRADNAAVAVAAAGGDADAHALLVARGVLIATRLDAMLRERHAGERSLQSVLRALVAAARRDDVRELSLAALLEHITVELGAGEVAGVRGMLAGGIPVLPAAALGACFTRGPRTYVRFDPGFDVVASRAGQIRGLRANGPAARAGVREGETVVSLAATSRDPHQPLELTLERDGQPILVTYRPIGASGRGEAWRRRQGADESTCPR